MSRRERGWPSEEAEVISERKMRKGLGRRESDEVERRGEERNGI